jgi:hypothetical protein
MSTSRPKLFGDNRARVGRHGRFRVINRPVVFTSNNKKAIIASGTEIPVPVNTLPMLLIRRT